MIDPYRRRLALLVAACYFMENLDGTIVTTAAPKLRAALGASSTAVGLLISSYLITFAVVIPIGNWLMSRWGERRLLLGAISLFTVASLLCGLSHDLTELIVARCAQGVGAALMVPVGRVVVLANSDKTDIVRLIAYIVWPGLLAPAIAPLVGGAIVTFASWRWLFWPNVPLGVAAFIAGAIIVKPSTRRTRVATDLDWRGLLLTGAGLGGFVYSAFVAGDLSSSWWRVGELLTASLVVLAAAALYLSRRRDPFLDVTVLRVRTFRESLRAMVPFTMVVGSLPLLLPLMFEERFGWSPLKAGVIVLFVFVGNVVAKPTTTPLLNRFGYRRVLLGAIFAVTLTVLGFALVDAETPVTVIAVLAFLNGVVRSIGYTGLLTLVYGDVAEEHMAHGTTLAATVQQVAAGFAASAGVVALRLGASISHRGPTVSQDAYRIAFMLLAALALAPLLNAYLMDATAGDALRSPRRVASG